MKEIMVIEKMTNQGPWEKPPEQRKICDFCMFWEAIVSYTLFDLGQHVWQSMEKLGLE